MEAVSITLSVSAFVAGLLMFLAPCTLPLLPAYLGFISGITHKELANGVSRRARRQVLLNALMFVLGFTAVFMALGLLAGVAGTLLAPVRQWLAIIGGVLIIVFGLFMLGVLKFSFFARERRPRLPPALTLGTPASSLLLGAAFAFGWTPCIGPILGTVLFFAGSTETIMTGAFLLMVFSLGFAVPFLLLALLMSQATRLVGKVVPYLRAMSMVGGAVLVIIGVSLVFGDTLLTEWFFRLFDHLDFGEALMRYL